MTKNEFDLLYEIKREGIQSSCSLAARTGLPENTAAQILNQFSAQGYLDESGITETGLLALAPYKVKNAVIMAAGMSSRFVPLSLEKPKGLLVVKNEVLVERQIEQLRAAGIQEIILVLGYKKEAFFYLEDKYNVKILINPAFNRKNNIETLYLAQKYIGNTYICSSDDYFEENVFDEYVYQSYYSAVHVKEKTNEWYMIPDAEGNIAQVKKSGEAGSIMLGHVYWDTSFSQAFIQLINKHHDLGDYDNNLWEDLLADHLADLPPMKIKEYPDNIIFEFDSLDELRQFDVSYVKNTRSKTMKNICSFFHCEESDITDIKAIKDGLTNTSFVFSVFGKKYVYRHPGEGTEAFISREHEKKALELAKSIHADPTYLYMNSVEGWKLSSYVENIRTPRYDSKEDTRRVLSGIRHLHDSNLSADWAFQPWQEALRIEGLLREKGEISVRDFDELKAKVEQCYQATVGDGVQPCFCHCGTYAANWMLTENETILIDWEYAGNADPGCDVGAYIMDAMYDIEDAAKFIQAYCGSSFNEQLLLHYLAYVAIVSYHWFVWALYRESCGAMMGESLHNWYVMAKKYANYLSAKL